MSWFRRETKSLFIARPDSAAGRLVHLHADTNIPRGARLTVRSDERAIFFRQGRAIGALEAGAYVLDTANIPFLGTLVIDPLTGGNHYITELFFVRTAETTFGIEQAELGTFVDLESKVLLRLLFDAEFTVRTGDGIRLITSLGGQSADSQSNIERMVQGRIRNMAKQIVAEESRTTPIQALISNAAGESFGNAIRQRLADEFASSGLDIVRFLEIHLALDPQSESDLRSYQSRVSDLNIQAHGAAIATQPGFSQFNIVQGQRKALEGLGDGLSKGGVPPMFGMGMGVMPGGGFAAMPPASSGPARGVPERPPVTSAGRYLVRCPRGNGGPYTPRQAALWVISSGADLATVEVCGSHDGGELWIPIQREPVIMAELGRRGATVQRQDPAGGGFESAFRAAIADGVVTVDEMQMLCAVATATAAASNHQEAEGMIRRRCAAAGCRILAAGETPPAPQTFTYFDGAHQHAGLSAEQVAAQVQMRPDGTHLVWTPQLVEWRDVRAVPEIAALLGPAAG
jgi:membrane protease subunit (stomatin/prohibitin family)